MRPQKRLKLVLFTSSFIAIFSSLSEGHAVECRLFPSSNMSLGSDYSGVAEMEPSSTCPDNAILTGVECAHGCTESPSRCAFMSVKCSTTTEYSRPVAEYAFDLSKNGCETVEFRHERGRSSPFYVSCKSNGIAAGIRCEGPNCTEGSVYLHCCDFVVGNQHTGVPTEFSRFQFRLNRDTSAVVRSLGQEGLCPAGEVVTGFMSDGKGKSAVACSSLRFDCKNDDCKCDAGWMGEECRQCTTANTCGGRGTCDANSGQCICSTGWTTNGDMSTSPCNDCAKGYFGDTCQPCECGDEESCEWGLRGTGKCTCNSQSCGGPTEAASAHGSLFQLGIAFASVAATILLAIVYRCIFGSSCVICKHEPGIPNQELSFA